MIVKWLKAIVSHCKLTARGWINTIIQFSCETKLSLHSSWTQAVPVPHTMMILLKVQQNNRHVKQLAGLQYVLSLHFTFLVKPWNSLTISLLLLMTGACDIFMHCIAQTRRRIISLLIWQEKKHKKHSTCLNWYTSAF